MAPSRLTEIAARLVKAEGHVDDLARGLKRWTVHIPARPDEDSDIIISSALTDLAYLLARLQAAEAVCEALQNTLNEISPTVDPDECLYCDGKWAADGDETFEHEDDCLIAIGNKALTTWQEAP